MPKISKRRRRAAEEVQDETPPESTTVESDPTGDEVGKAIDWVRRALAPFNVDTRRRILRAASVFLK